VQAYLTLEIEYRYDRVVTGMLFGQYFALQLTVAASLPALRLFVCFMHVAIVPELIYSALQHLAVRAAVLPLECYATLGTFCKAPSNHHGSNFHRSVLAAKLCVLHTDVAVSVMSVMCAWSMVVLHVVCMLVSNDIVGGGCRATLLQSL
jgi:hypothetical protein